MNIKQTVKRYQKNIRPNFFIFILRSRIKLRNWFATLPCHIALHPLTKILHTPVRTLLNKT